MNCHLAHGKSNSAQRFDEMNTIFGTSFKDQGGLNILDHDIKFIYGDLNFRINLEIPTICNLATEGKFEEMRQYDQLLDLIHRYIPQPILNEEEIKFNPTYKYTVGTSEYALKKRPPAWCDRILWVSGSSVKPLGYDCASSLSASDHKPIYGIYSVGIIEEAEEEPALPLVRYQTLEESKLPGIKSLQNKNIMKSKTLRQCEIKGIKSNI